MKSSKKHPRISNILSVLPGTMLMFSLTFSIPLLSEGIESGNTIYPTPTSVKKSSPELSHKNGRLLENFGYIHMTVPLEAVIGRLFLGNDSKMVFASYSSSLQGKNQGNPYDLEKEINIANPSIPIVTPTDGRGESASVVKRRDSIKIYHINQGSSFVGLDLLRLKSSQIGSYRYGDTLLGSITMGYSLKDKSDPETAPVNVLLGLTSIYNTPERINQIEVSGTEYGTVFFVPGLQISGKSVIFQAMVELPIFRINPENAIYHQQDLRANFGMKYIIQ